MTWEAYARIVVAVLVAIVRERGKGRETRKRVKSEAVRARQDATFAFRLAH